MLTSSNNRLSSEAIMLMNWGKKTSNGRNEIISKEYYIFLFSSTKTSTITNRTLIKKSEHISNEE